MLVTMLGFVAIVVSLKGLLPASMIGASRIRMFNGPGRGVVGALWLLAGVLLTLEGVFSPLGIAKRLDVQVFGRLERSNEFDPQAAAYDQQSAERELARLPWTRYDGDAYGFRVLLPGKPVIASEHRSTWVQTVFELNGGKLIASKIVDGEVQFKKLPRDPSLDIFDRVDTFAVDLPIEISFGVWRENFAHVPPDVESELQTFANNLKILHGERTLADRAILLGDIPGRELISEIGQPPLSKTFVKRIYIHDGALFHVIALVDKRDMQTTALKRFFDSFEFVPRPGPLPPPQTDSESGPAMIVDDQGVGRVVSDPAAGIYRRTAPADFDQWQKFRSDDDGFEARFPFEPVRKVDADPQSTRYSMSCDGDRLGFIVTVERQWSQGSAVKQFKWRTDRDVKSGHIVVNDIQYGDDPSVVADYRITALGRTLRFRQRLFDLGTMAYSVEVFYEADEDHEADVKRFFDSFHLLKSGKLQQP